MVYLYWYYTNLENLDATLQIKSFKNDTGD